MAWETRPRGSRYYTRSKRVNGKVVRVYIGTGPAGMAAAMEDASDRAIRKQLRQAAVKELAAMEHRFLRADALLEDLDIACNGAVERTLRCLGYHCHRGMWRLRRGNKTVTG